MGLRALIHMTFLNCSIILRILFVSRISAAHRSPVAPHVTLVSLLFWTYIGFSNAKEGEFKHIWCACRNIAKRTVAF